MSLTLNTKEDISVVEISIHDSLRNKEDPHVFVVNNTKQIKTLGNTRGAEINIPVSDGGVPNNLVVPLTWIPWDLSTAMSKELILASTQFRQALNRGFISLVSTESAIEVMKSDKARAEFNRLRETSNHVISRDEIMGNTTIQATIEGLPDAAKGLLEQAYMDVNPSLLGILSNEEASDDSILAGISNIEEELLEQDWKYLATSDLASDTVKKYATEVLSKR